MRFYGRLKVGTASHLFGTSLCATGDEVRAVRGLRLTDANIPLQSSTDWRSSHTPGQIGDRIMSISSVQTYVMDHENEADSYLETLFQNPENRSMDVVHQRAATINFKNDHFRNYFINKGRELLAR